jgi:hypothetical protein
MGGTRLGHRPRWKGILLAGLAWVALLTAPAASAAAKGRHRHVHVRVASVSVKVPNLGDVTLARVVLRVKVAPGARGARALRKRTLRFSLVNGKRLPRSVVIIVGGKRLSSVKAGVAQLARRSGQSATFVAAIAIFNPRPGAGIPRAHQAAGVPPDSVATFEASTEGEDTVVVTAEFHQDILANDQSGRVALCPKGSQFTYQFSRAAFDEVAGPDGLTPEIIELVFKRAVEACFEEANTTGEQLLFEWLNPGMGTVTPPPVTPPSQPALDGTFGGTTNTGGDPMRISLSGQFNRAITGVTFWAPINTHFTACDPVAACKIEGYGGGTANSVYYTVNVPANQPFPPGLNLELDHVGNYSDTFQGQAKAADGSLSSWKPFNLSG